MDQPDGLAGKDGCNIEIPGIALSGVLGRDSLDIVDQLSLAPHPSARMVVDQGAGGEGRRPPDLARDVEDHAAQRIA
jgi:hypothetical protein